MIRFFIRSVFWLAVVLLVLPFVISRPESRSNVVDTEPQAGSREAVAALSGAVSDASSFCERQPDACDAGKSVVSAIGSQLRDGAATLAYLLNEALNDAEDDTSVQQAQPQYDPSSSGTLTPEDRDPEWQGDGDKLPPV
ncbi:DUF5330 domain-containing protein [Amorphus sp. 3PC139-8]|uniref:DUF5330 domain-containing protein n=1 Tax=Amorphus sp. 3PC139-8 TaxID=2735676 RepID=UPI00345DAD3B